MAQNDAQAQPSQPEVKSSTSTSAVPHLWNNLLRWCNSDMQAQMRKVNARPHECKTCGKRFTLLENLNRHQMIHTNQRPFHCPYCSKSFRLSQHLKEHIRIHTGEKPYKCHICGHAFCQISNLKSHQKTHTKVKGFRCDQCGKEFRRSFTLKQHKLTHNKSAKSSSKGAATAKTHNTSKTGSESSALSEVANVMTTMKSDSYQKAQNAEVTSGNPSTITQAPAKNGTLLYQNLISNSPTEKSHSVAQENDPKRTQLMSLWNAFHQNKPNEKTGKSNSVQQKLSEHFRPTTVANSATNSNSYSHISKFLALTNTNLNQIQSSQIKAGSSPTLPIMTSEPWFCKKATAQAAANMSANGSSKETTKPAATSPALKISAHNDVIVSPSSQGAEKTNYENSTRKWKQTRSLYEPVVSCSSLFDDFSTKNSQLLPRTKPFKSLTLSQDYNWKRQLCREWQQTDRQEWLHGKLAQGRSSSVDLPRDDPYNSVFSVGLGDSKLHKNDFVKSENPDVTLHPSTSFDDDVFTPLSARSLATPRDTSKINVTPNNNARSTTFLQGQREIFQYPDIPSAKRIRKCTDSTSDGNSTKTSPCLKTSTEIERSPNFGTRSIPPLFLPAERLDSQKTASPFYPNPFFDFNSTPCLTDPLRNSKLPLSPDFKALANSLSFVPLVTWKPVVTGWRNMLDGNVYPARMGVDNLNPFNLQQQQIS